MLVYGSRATHVADFQLKDIPCDHCGETSGFHMSFFARHGHLYWIPFLPVGKTAVAECNNCKRTFAEEEFNPTLSGCRDELRNRVKAPIWNWAGLMIIAALVVGWNLFDTFRYHDPREALLDADINMMTVSPSATGDSISYNLKEFLDFALHEDMQAEDVQYYTKVDGDKVLVLVKGPYFHDVALSERPEMLELLEMVIDAQADLEDKDKYYALLSNMNRVLIAKAPNDADYSKGDREERVYDFYGPAAE